MINPAKVFEERIKAIEYQIDERLKQYAGKEIKIQLSFESHHTACFFWGKN